VCGAKEFADLAVFINRVNRTSFERVFTAYFTMSKDSSADEWQTKVEEIKREKRKQKSAITKLLNTLAEKISSKQDGSIEEIKVILQRLEELKDNTVELIDELCELYKKGKQDELAIKADEEADEIIERIDHEAALGRRALTSSATKSSNQSPQPQVSPEVPVNDKNSSNGFTNLERIKLPTFNGNKSQFPQWNATFTSCVDETSMTAQYKMLRLESCLTGEALDTIKGLGYSEEAYKVAKARLVRKYGGDRRDVQGHLDELLKLKPIKDDNPKALEKFADMLERAVIKLQENNRKADLEVGTLYTIILEKLPEKTISQYYRWVKEQDKQESLITLKDWTAEEAEIQMQAAELKYGLKADTTTTCKPPERRSNPRAYGTLTSEPRPQTIERKRCRCCGGQHGLWSCESFKSKTVKDRWSTAKKLGVCYRCLSDGHLGNKCPRSRVCNLNGCTDSHHRLLHMDKNSETTVQPGPTTATPPGPFQFQSYNGPPTHFNHYSFNGKAPLFTPPSNSSFNVGSNFQTSSESQFAASRNTEGDPNTHTATRGNVALRTIPVVLKHENKRLSVNCFIDEGSDTTYINEDVIHQFGIQGEKEWINVNVANAQQVSFPSMTFNIGIASLDKQIDTIIKAKTSVNICGGMRAVNWINLKNNYKHLKDIPFFPVTNQGKIDILLGTDNYHLIYPIQEIIGAVDEPYARRCPLGWTAVGHLGNNHTQSNYNTKMCNTYNLQSVNNEMSTDLNARLKQFWDLDTMGITPSGPAMSPEEQLALKKVSQSLTYQDGHYAVAIPWKHDRPKLPNNRHIAEQRLKATERKLAMNPEVAVAYKEVIDDYLDKGYIRRVPTDETQPETEWLLPHFPVTRPDKTTTKTRIVFDASAEFNGTSLNKAALPGPKLQTDILDILIRFRKELIALVGDISQMYHQVIMLPEDRPLHRFLWRDLNLHQEPEVYEFSRLIFGGCYGPFCAQYVWQRHAEVHRQQYPLASKAVKDNCYMDDVMCSAKSIEEAKEVRRQLTELSDKAGFHIRKWISQKPEVIEDIPVADRAKEVNLQQDEFQSTKTLGVLWTVQDDKMTFHYTAPSTEFVFTKRNVLKKVATIFDPFGFLAPYVVRAKLLMQEAWMSSLGWDEELPDHLQRKWKQWFNELELLDKITVQRCLRDDKEVQDITVHTFSDASDKAYAAATYTRHEYDDGTVSIQLVAAKSRLAPVKAVSIPRLELMGALTGQRLTKKVCLALNLSLDKVTYWVDSDNVGFWIQGQSRNYKPFVAHRVGEIHEESNPDQWRYVSTKVNPADKATRGLSADELSTDDCWWHGPTFLQNDQSEWPTRKFGSAPDAQREVKSDKRVQLTANGNDTDQQEHVTYITAEPQESRPDVTNYSKWYKTNPKRKLEIGISLVRVVGWMKRFINNARTKPDDRNRSNELTVEELKAAELHLIKSAQQECFYDEIEALTNHKPLPKKSSILTLTPILMDGVLRANTRLRYSENLPDDVKYPIILPKGHAVTKLIVKYHHETEGHVMGVNYTLNHLREKYFVIHSRQEVKRCIKDCAECSRCHRGGKAQQQMAPLPRIRLEVTERPFTNCATDFAGPFYTMQGRGKARLKRYLCLFVCLQTRCCHLEMATSLETDGFMNAFTRFVARRGWPKLMLSDNGTNYVGAQREIKELVENIDQEKVQRMTSNRGVTWLFNPPAGPHFGGVFEIMIKAAKRAIYAELSGADVNDEELETVIIGAESLLNSRPLTTVSGDHNDEMVLTPNHFLIGQMGGELAPESVDDTPGKMKQRWRRVQELIRKVWHRWMKEYLPLIGSRHKWFLPAKNLSVGDVVLEIDPKTPRRTWKLGRVVQVYAGQDGLVRVVDVRLGGRVMRRPIHKLSPLE